MTVKELKKLLENLPDDADVCYYNSDNDYSETLANDVDYDKDLDIVYLM